MLFVLVVLVVVVVVVAVASMLDKPSPYRAVTTKAALDVIMKSVPAPTYAPKSVLLIESLISVSVPVVVLPVVAVEEVADIVKAT